MNIKNKMKFSFLGFLITIMTINCNNQNKSNLENTTTKKSIFSVPFADVKIENTIYQISNERDTILTYKTGSKIVIPKNAFLDKDGNPIKGSVKLTYREFTNPFDIYLGGIPMVYDSAGIEQVFETAGMIEINAYSQDQSVFPNPKNKIQVQMNSFQKGDEYNVYQLDTITGKWNDLGKDKVEIDDYNKSLASLPQVPPTPKKAGQFSFSIGDDTGNYPELNIFQNVLFEPIDGKYVGFNGTEIKVKDLGNGIYEVLFIMNAYGVHEEQSCKCYLAFKEGVDYDNALKVYQNKYKSLIDKRDKMKKEIEMEWENYRLAVKKYDIAVFNKDAEFLTENERVMRTLSINGFGFINCDYPTSYPQGAELLAKYKDKQGNEIKLNNIVLVEKGRNAIFHYTSKIKFNPRQENILWGITSDNKIAYIKADDFKKVNITSGEYTFTMNVHSETLKTYEDICKVLF